MTSMYRDELAPLLKWKPFSSKQLRQYEAQVGINLRREKTKIIIKNKGSRKAIYKTFIKYQTNVVGISLK